MLVVFDLDGTLIDSRQDLADSANDVLMSFGAPPLTRDQVVSMVGDGARVLVERVLAASGASHSGGGLDLDLDVAFTRFTASYEARLLETTVPYDGINDMLVTAGARATLAMLTNKPLAPTLRLVEAFGWSSHFLDVVGGDGPLSRKPDPAGLQFLMAKAGAEPSATMLVGDSMVDVETARRAGAAACVVEYGFGGAHGHQDLRGDEWLAVTGKGVAEVIREWVRPL